MAAVAIEDVAQLLGVDAGFWALTDRKIPPPWIRSHSNGIFLIDAMLGEQAGQAAGNSARASADGGGFADRRGGDRSGRGEWADAGDGQRGNAEQRAGAAPIRAPLTRPSVLSPTSVVSASPNSPSVPSRLAITTVRNRELGGA